MKNWTEQAEMNWKAQNTHLAQASKWEGTREITYDNSGTNPAVCRSFLKALIHPAIIVYDHWNRK